MQLIGMLDSPYVRRTAISLLTLGLRFEHRSLSVFRSFDEFRRINPVVRVPTLVCDDGTVLMESTLILQWAETLARPRTLLPAEPGALARELRLIGLALAACDKSVQIVYENLVRPPQKAHEPWMARVSGQLCAAYAELEAELTREPPPLDGPGGPTQAAISVAVAWHFTQQMHPEVVCDDDFSALEAFSARAEALPAFRAAPHGEDTVSQAG